jgi:hypothetical protein
LPDTGLRFLKRLPFDIDTSVAKAELQITPAILLDYGRFGHLRHLHFSGPSLANPCPCIQCRLVSHSVKPVADHFPRHYGTCLSDKDEEGGVEGILGVMMIEEATTDAPDHRAVPLHESFQSRSFSTAHETLQQLPVRSFHHILRKHRLAKIVDGSIHGTYRHTIPFCWRPFRLYLFI